MALNGISTLATKELRQKAKLDLAAAKRAADGYTRATYDITQLPTQYDDNGIIDNPNIDGLVLGRPWIDAPPTPTFSVTPRNSTINEGGNIIVDIATTNFADGNVYFTVSGVSASDIQSGILPSGDTYVASGSASVSFNTGEDLTTEGTETLVFEVRTGSISGPIVATCNITINDTSLTPTPSFITNNLVLHLDAANAASYPGSGTTWTDLSGNNRNATLTDVTYTSNDGGALVFNGSTSIGTINDTVINRYTNNFSVEVWYSSNNNTPRLLRTGQSSQGFNLGSYTNTPTKWKVTKYGVIDLFVGNIPQNTNWHQVVLVYSNTLGTKVYVDGVLAETNLSGQNVRAATWNYLEVGRSEAGSHNGNIGIIRYYNAVLSNADVLQNFDANKARYGL